MTPDLSHDTLWTPGLKPRLRAKLRFYDPAITPICTLKGLPTELIPRAHVEDYIIADTTLIDGTVQRVIVHRANVIWPRIEKPDKPPKTSKRPSKEVAKLIKALKQFDPERLAALLGQVDKKTQEDATIPY